VIAISVNLFLDLKNGGWKCLILGEVFKQAWDIKCHEEDPVQIWQCKIRNLRRKIKGWNKNREAEIKRDKKELISEGDKLDLLAEGRPLSDLDLED
jgi:hypothetical protein